MQANVHVASVFRLIRGTKYTEPMGGYISWDEEERRSLQPKVGFEPQPLSRAQVDSFNHCMHVTSVFRLIRGTKHSEIMEGDLPWEQPEEKRSWQEKWNHW